MRKLLSFLMAFCFLAPIFFGSCEKMMEDFKTGEASIDVLRNYKMIPVIDTLYQKETIIKVDTLVVEKEGKTDTLIIRDTIKVPEYVPVIKIDTVYVRDTITNTIIDTVYKEKIVYDTVYVEKTKIDTVFVNKTDTLYVELEVEIEKPVYIRDTVIIRDTTCILPDGAYYGKPYVGGKETAYLPEFIFVDGVHVETNLIPAKFKFQLTAGNPILVGATPALTNNEATVNNNTFSYLYYAGNNVFDSWMVDFNREVTFVTSDGRSINHTLTEKWEPMSLAYYRTSDVTWDHLSAAVINSIIQDTDVQQLYMMPESPEYTFAHEHKTSKVLTAEMQIRDTHNGIVYENGKAVERAAYDALHQVYHSQSNAIEYHRISSVENRVFTLDNGVARIANATVVEDVKLIECDNLYMETTETWYCHPAFPTSGAEAVLGCCQPEAISIRTGKYNGENLPATLIVKGEQEKEFPIVLTTEPKPVIQPTRTVKYSSATPVSATKAKVEKSIYLDDKLDSKSDILVDWYANLECGNMETISNMNTLSYGAPVSARNGDNTIAMNLLSFNAKVTTPATVSFTDEGATQTVKVEYNSLTIESNGNISRVDNSNADFNIIDNTAYFKLVCNGFTVDTDDKKIQQKKEIYKPTRTVKYSTATPVSATKAKVEKSIYLDDKLDSKSDILVDWYANLECGNMETISNMNTLSYGASVSARNGDNTIAMNLLSFNAKVTTPATVSFTDEGATQTVKVEYNSLTIESNGNISRVDNSNADFNIIDNTAYFKLVCNGFTVDTDDKKIQQKKEKPQASLIEGYTVIAAYITTCYHKGSNDDLVSDGNQMAIVARKNNDASKYIIRRANATTGEKIEDYNVNNVDESKIFSFRTVEGKLKPAYLDVIRVDNKAASWAYQDISSFNPNDTNTFFAVSKWYVINYRLTDPLIEVGKVENGGVSINGKFFK